MARRALTLAIAVISLAGVLAACGVREDDKPREILRPALPRQLFEPNPSSTTTQPPTEHTQYRKLYLVRGTDTLAETFVGIESPRNPADIPRVVIDNLINRPPVTSNSELTSAIPPDTKLRSVVQHDDVLDIDLSGLGTVESTNQRLAVAQIVFTATAIEGINGVRFLIDGSPTAVPLDESTSEIGATITRDDFPKLRPGAVTTTTTVAPDSTDTTAVAPTDQTPSSAPR